MASSGGSDSCHSVDLNLKVVSFNGDHIGDFVAPAGEKVEQFIERLALDKADVSAEESVMLLHGDRVLPPSHALQDCGVLSGATLKIVRELQSRLQLTAFFRGNYGVLSEGTRVDPSDSNEYSKDEFIEYYGEEEGVERWNSAAQDPSFFSWVDEASPALKLSSGAVAWCHKVAEGCMDGACGAICSLQNAGPMQRLVDNGELSKAEAAEAILTCFIRCLLAAGCIGANYGMNYSHDSAVATAGLRECLPQIACGVNLLSGREPLTPEQIEPYLQYIREHSSLQFTPEELAIYKSPEALERYRCDVMSRKIQVAELFLKEGLTEAFQLDVHEKLDSCLDLGCEFNRSCEFVKSLKHSECGNVWCTIVGDDLALLNNDNQNVKFAAGVHLEGERAEPDQLPTYYVLQWAKTD